MTDTKQTVGQNFILGGDAIFTLVGRESRFTYRVSRVDPEPGSKYERFGPAYFVKVLTGADNTRDYSYLGKLDPRTGYVTLTKGSRFTVDTPSVKAIQWALPKIWAQQPMPASFAIHHEGWCGRCARKLTVPDSIVTGFGPECSEKLGLTQVSAGPKGRKAAPKAATKPEPVKTDLVGLASRWDSFLTTELPA